MQKLTKTVLFMVCLSLLQVPLAEARGNNGVNKNQAVRAARAQYPGKVVKITDSNKYYRIRVLQKNGRVVTVKVDKKTGKVSK